MKKSVNCSRDCLFTLAGSSKPFPSNKPNNPHLTREPFTTYSRRKFTRLRHCENNSYKFKLFYTLHNTIFYFVYNTFLFQQKTVAKIRFF